MENLKVKEDPIKVRKTTNVKALASAITNALEEYDVINVRSIGVVANSQALKALAVVGGFLGQKGKSLHCRIGFEDIFVEDRDAENPISAINFTCFVSKM